MHPQKRKRKTPANKTNAIDTSIIDETNDDVAAIGGLSNKTEAAALTTKKYTLESDNDDDDDEKPAHTTAGTPTEPLDDDERPARGAGRVYLKVPYNQKDEAKTNFKCQWDPDVAHWYVLDADSDAALQQYPPATIAQIRDGRNQTLQKRQRREATSQILANSPPRTPPRPAHGNANVTLEAVKTFINTASIEDVLKAFKFIQARKQEVLQLLREAAAGLE